MVKTFKFVCDEVITEDTQGYFVSYEDYAELKAQRNALAAENVALKDVFGPGDAVLNFLTIALRHTTYDEIDLNDVSLAFQMSLPETPATDTFINSVRADSIVGAVSRITSQVWQEDEGAGMSAAVNALAIIEQELRAGEPS